MLYLAATFAVIENANLTHCFYLLLGTNLGNREQLLAEARKAISQCGSIQQLSAVYESEAWGIRDQPSFLNQALVLKSDLSPKNMLSKLLSIEAQLGRIRKGRWMERCMDIDILFCDRLIVQEPDLIIPHPELHNRNFTLQPLAEIAPQFVHPVLQKTISQLAHESADKLQVWPLEPAL